MKRVCWCATLLLLAVEAGAASLAIYPSAVVLHGAGARQRFLVVLTTDDGVTRDVSAEAALRVTDPARLKIDGHSLLPLADGATELVAEHAGQTVRAAVTVASLSAQRPTSFKLDVMPVFMRAGCNSGACHGSARGQDGFHLSLFGYDPDGDHRALTREAPTRRLNLALPEESLLVEKSIGAVPHTGGKRFDVGSEHYNTLLAWLRGGAALDGGAVPAVEAVEIFPPAAVLQGAGVKQPFIVRAKYADGRHRDVTSLAVFLTNNDNSAPIDADGVVTAAAPGEAFVMARFGTHTVGSQVIVLAAGQGRPPEVEPPANYIDALVAAKLRKLRIAPAERCSDAVFLRRATLDIAGMLPTPDEYRRFVADRAADKRARLVDRLLERKEFSEIWAMNWAELLMIRSTNELSYKTIFLYNDWLSRQIAANVPIDRLVRELLSASGGTFGTPPTNFYQVETDTLKTAENVAQLFMGIRVQCAQCHNHPFDRWTMDDYYSFAAFFGQVGRKQGEDYRETVVFDRGAGEVRHPVGNRPMPPKFLGGPVPDVKEKDRRAALAEWLTSAENPQFAASIANRVWAFFFGRGIVEPVDDFRVSNPASNPELLAALGQKLIEYRYDFKRLVRDICNSQAYQRATAKSENLAAAQNFAHARLRRIKSEILLDCISQATETKDKFKGLPLGARAIHIADGTTTNYFLTTFGRTPRETVCAADVRTEPTLSQALHLVNGETIQQKIAAGGAVKRWIAEGRKPPEIVRELYIRTLCREPSDGEIQKLLGAGGSLPPVEVLQDAFWALLNSREFIFNH